ncbi:MAG TPA: hypothetical protein VM308_01625 [Sphingomicrobium sp.]|nr:hypothetical protein [Sphingomicrobium sp.]
MLGDVPHAISNAMGSWYQGKLFLEHSLTISHDSLHIVVGVLFWIAVGLLIRRPLTSWRPWLWLLVVTLWNEAVDLWVEQWPDAGQQYGEGAKDVILTMLVPTIVLFAARSRPDLFRAGLGKRRR